jgi:hypothetical protein
MIRTALTILGIIGLFAIVFGAGFFIGLHAFGQELLRNPDKYRAILMGENERSR